MRVFVAGATGVVGQFLVPSLVAAGHEVTGTTRSTAKAASAAEPPARRPSSSTAWTAGPCWTRSRPAQPEVIVHQMTALASMSSFRNFDKEFAVTNELRTRAPTTCWKPRSRRAPAGSSRRASSAGTNAQDRRPGQDRGRPARPRSGPVDPQVHGGDQARRGDRARRGRPRAWCCATARFYGHGASDNLLDAVRKRQMPVIGGGTGIWSFCEITDAAAATAAAVSRGAPGIYNIVDDDPAPVRSGCRTWPSASARSRRCVPRPGWAGCWPSQLVVSLMTRVRGSVNEKAKQRTRLGAAATRAGGTASGTGRKRRSRPVPPEVVSPDDYAEFRPLMFSIAYRMTGSISDAEDIVQEALPAADPGTARTAPASTRPRRSWPPALPGWPSAT